MIIAVDFDGTLCSDNRFGPPAEGAQEALRRLRGRGHRIIVHTCRGGYPGGLAAVRRWCLDHHIPVDDVTVVKPAAHVFVDDRAIRFTTWADVLAQLTTRPERASPNDPGGQQCQT